MRIPEGVKEKYGQGKTCRFKKSLFRLKQALRVWLKQLLSDLLKIKFETLETTECLFIVRSKWNNVFPLVYVDDVILMSTSLEMILQVRAR